MTEQRTTAVSLSSDPEYNKGKAGTTHTYRYVSTISVNSMGGGMDQKFRKLSFVLSYCLQAMTQKSVSVHRMCFSLGGFLRFQRFCAT